MGPEQQTIIGLLGPVAVITAAGPESGALPEDSAIAVVPGIRAKRLLTSLALAGGRTRSAERLINDVWGDTPPRSPASALHTQISRLRGLLGAAHIEASGTGYRLVGCRTDLDVVMACAADEDATSLADAMGWFRGTAGDDLGADGSDELIEQVRTRATEVADALDRRRGGAAMARGDFDLARSIAEKRCRTDILDESAHLDLMRALVAMGRGTDAISVYARLRRALAAELGVDPGPQISALHDELLAGAAHDGLTPAGDSASPRRGRSSGLFSETTGLIGRARDVEAIDALLGTHRLVTVQGPGGVGKTRVANRVGHRRVDAGDSVHFVPLAPIRNDDDVVPAIAAALGVGEAELTGSGRPRRAVGDLQERLLDALRGRRVLLILDNCEQVIDRCARLVADLLAADPALRVLVTSRSPLMLPAEQIYLLPVLDVEGGGAAMELFVTRAVAVRPGADLDPAAVAGLCRHLDGLPLAIELAAARIRTMTVDEIAGRLAERFALLRGADRSAPDRHRTLYAVIDWSWDLLDDDARAALRRLCRFPAGFTTDAAEIVTCFRGVRLDDALASLVNQSLLTVAEEGGHVRYRMLEMVREFGEGKLASDAGESEDVRAGMRRWARSLAADVMTSYEDGVDEELIGAVAADAENLVWVLRDCVDALEASQSDLPVQSDPAVQSDPVPSGATPGADGAVDTAVVNTVVTVFPILAGFWMARGLHAEVMNWGGRLLGVLPPPPVLVADTAVRRAWQATLLMSMAHRVLHHDLRALATGRYYLRRLFRADLTYLSTTDFVTACVLSRTPIAALRHIVRATLSADAAVSTAALSARMNLRENLGQLDGALADALQLREVAAPRDVWLSGMAQVRIASIHGQQAQWRTAVEFYRVGVVDLVRLGAYEDEIQARVHLVITLVALGELQDAATELAILSEGWTPADPDPQANPEMAAGILLSHAEYALARGEVDTAGDLYRRTMALLRRDHPIGAGDPSVAMMVAMAEVGLMRCGRARQARGFVPMIVDGLVSTYTGGWFDVPQAGSIVLAAGYVLLDDPRTHDDGVRLLMLSRRMGARRDSLGLYLVDRDMRELSEVDSVRWDNEIRDVERIRRRQAAAEVRTILASFRDADQALRI
ncbi:BTAD domain-containing putative transcriptional regulator [Gordonia sp. VNQ95]|uniref:BTAD domain-containing putative transcriptional regulator n=1 Tax=Gordonia sp. VNQ95 TaxID=3156619 RepID=UPI0032B47970